MYKPKLWDEDKWNIHSSSYNSQKYASSKPDEKKDDKSYNEQKYGSKEKSISSDYMRKHEEKEKDKKESDPFSDVLEEEKNEKKEINEEEIPFKAAKQVFEENKEDKKIGHKKDVKTIEEAIKNAIEEEKKVIIVDN